MAFDLKSLAGVKLDVWRKILNKARKVGGDYRNYMAFFKAAIQENHQCLNFVFCRTSGGLCNWRDWCRADSFWCSVHLLILYTKVTALGLRSSKRQGHVSVLLYLRTVIPDFYDYESKFHRRLFVSWIFLPVFYENLSGLLSAIKSPMRGFPCSLSPSTYIYTCNRKC